MKIQQISKNIQSHIDGLNLELVNAKTHGVSVRFNIMLDGTIKLRCSEQSSIELIKTIRQIVLYEKRTVK